MASRSVPRNIRQKGEHLSRCDVCATPYLRSALVRREDGLLVCENDRSGRCELTLARVTAEQAKSVAASAAARTPADGAFPHLDGESNPVVSDYAGPVRRRTEADVYASGNRYTF